LPSHEKNNFTEVIKNLDTYILKIILLGQQINYVRNSSMMSNVAKNFDILAIILNVLRNYFDIPIKLFSDLYLAKFLDTSVKLFFSYNYYKTNNNSFYNNKQNEIIIIKDC